MPLSLLNLVVAKAMLERDKVITDPDEIQRASAIAALIPGPMGLIVPLAAERRRRDEEEEDEVEEEEDNGGKGKDSAVRRTLEVAVAKIDSMEQSMKAQMSNIELLPTLDRVREMEESLSRRMDALDKLLADQIKALPETTKAGAKASN